MYRALERIQAERIEEAAPEVAAEGEAKAEGAAASEGAATAEGTKPPPEDKKA